MVHWSFQPVPGDANRNSSIGGFICPSPSRTLRPPLETNSINNSGPLENTDSLKSLETVHDENDGFEGFVGRRGGVFRNIANIVGAARFEMWAGGAVLPQNLPINRSPSVFLPSKMLRLSNEQLQFLRISMVFWILYRSTKLYNIIQEPLYNK